MYSNYYSYYDYSPYANGLSNSASAIDGLEAAILAITGLLSVIFIVLLALLVLQIIGMWRVFTKAGEKGWKAIIPFYNIAILYKISGMSPYLVFVYLGLLIPFINIFCRYSNFNYDIISRN